MPLATAVRFSIGVVPVPLRWNASLCWGTRLSLVLASFSWGDAARRRVECMWSSWARRRSPKFLFAHASLSLSPRSRRAAPTTVPRLRGRERRERRRRRRIRDGNNRIRPPRVVAAVGRQPATGGEGLAHPCSPPRSTRTTSWWWSLHSGTTARRPGHRAPCPPPPAPRGARSAHYGAGFGTPDRPRREAEDAREDADGREGRRWTPAIFLHI